MHFEPHCVPMQDDQDAFQQRESIAVAAIMQSHLQHILR